MQKKFQEQTLTPTVVVWLLGDVGRVSPKQFQNEQTTMAADAKKLNYYIHKTFLLIKIQQGAVRWAFNLWRALKCGF